MLASLPVLNWVKALIAASLTVNIQGFVLLHDYTKLIRSHGRILLFGLLAVFAGNFGQSFFISWYGPEIQKSLGLSATAYGSAYSFATLVSGFMIMFVGGLIDRVSLKLFVTCASLGLALAALLMWRADSLFSLVLAFFFLRFFGQGLMPHTGITAMGRFFSINRGKAISLVINGVPLGEIILPSIAVVLITAAGWQGSWLIIAIFVSLVLWPAMFLLLSESTERPEDELGARAGSAGTAVTSSARLALLSDPRFWLALPLILAPPFIVTGLFIHQGFILADKGWSRSTFAQAFVIYGVFHWLSAMVAGWMVDKFQATKLLPLIGPPFILGLALAAWLEVSWSSVVLLMLLGSGIGAIGPIVNSLWAEVYGVERLGSIRAFSTSLMIISTAVSPVLFGYFIDGQMTANTLFYLLAIYVVAASLLALFSYHRFLVRKS